MFRDSHQPVLNDSQLYINELTGNRCIQPPIVHQYSVSLFRHKPTHLAVFLLVALSLLFSLSLFFRCVSAASFFESHSISILRTSFVSLLCIQMIGLTGRRKRLRGRVGWFEVSDERWRAGFGNQVSPKPDLCKVMTAGGMHC